MKHSVVRSIRVAHLVAPALLALLPAGMQTAWAQGTPAAYPTRPITMVVPFAPGGAVDLEARMYTPRLTALLGQSVVIDYKPGAGNTTGTGYVAKSRPDGYNVLAISTGLTVFPAFYKNLNFDVQKDLAPITLMSNQQSVITARPDFPARNLVEYLAYARQNPGKINYGTAGAGAISHLAGAWMHSASNTQVTFVHHKGTGPLLLEVQAGRVDVGTGLLVAQLPLIKAGRVKPLAVMSDPRNRQLPDLPSVSEQGVPGYNYASWIGFLAAGATPAPIISKLHDAFVRTVKSPEIVAELDRQGSIPVGSTPEQFRQHITSELARWKKVVEDAGLKLEE